MENEGEEEEVFFVTFINFNVFWDCHEIRHEIDEFFVLFLSSIISMIKVAHTC